MTPPKFMLDTNIISEIVKKPRGPAAQRARVHQDEICTSIIVASESRYGCAKKGSTELLRKIEQILSEISVLPLDTPADDVYGALLVALEAAGQPIGANDLFITAHAHSLKLTLVTANVRAFSRVQGLNFENWLTAS